ncbi:DRTGG domain-containing protein [Acutalibacter intestini]|uniref:DRTGG domain-containing protein n=1 Tax=Acutalibacter intestini TaxID=3093659 RepID=UPI002AC9272A|nr:DRTGG domain-containing protein [Acutalibacter sp. M00204]
MKEMAETLGWKLLAGEDGQENKMDGCYIGDLLSWVMGRAQAGNVWLTVMGNLNAIAVAALADVAGIVLCEDAALDQDAQKRADMQGIPVYACAENLYQTAIKVYEAQK